jgi:hypothetical protein
MQVIWELLLVLLRAMRNLTLRISIGASAEAENLAVRRLRD